MEHVRLLMFCPAFFWPRSEKSEVDPEPAGNVRSFVRYAGLGDVVAAYVPGPVPGFGPIEPFWDGPMWEKFGAFCLCIWIVI